MPNEYVPLVAMLIFGSIIFSFGMWASHKPKPPKEKPPTSAPAPHSPSSE